MELRYEDENIWLTQRLMAELYGIEIPTINEHINNLLQLKGKTLIPFATSGSSTIDQSVEYLRKTYPSLKWQDGKLITLSPASNGSRPDGRRMK